MRWLHWYQAVCPCHQEHPQLAHKGKLQLPQAAQPRKQI